MASGTHIRTGVINHNDETFRYGLTGDIKIEIVKGATNETDGTPVTGSYMFASYGINIARNNQPFKEIVGASNSYNYSEQLNLGSASVTGKIYVPDQKMINPKTSEEVYITGINGNMIYANIVDSISGSNESYNSGLAASLGSGSTVSFTQSGGWNGGTVVTDFFLRPGDLSREMKHSTGSNGNIQTTRGTDLQTSNSSGDLTDGTGVLGPGTYSVPNNKAVNYTMTPNDGYVIKKLTVDGEDKTEEAKANVVKDSNGKIKYYTYQINGDTANHEINVEWEEGVGDFYFVKKWVPEPSGNDAELSLVAKAYSFNGTAFTEETGVTGSGAFTVKATTSGVTVETVTGGKLWKIKKENLPLVKDGKTLYWFITETLPADFTMEYDNSGIEDATVKNATNKPAGVFASLVENKGGIITNTNYKELTIKNTVTGNMADIDKAFKYTFKTNSNSVMTLIITYKNGTTATTTIADGGEFELKHGETAKIQNIIKGSEYTITEQGTDYTRYYKIENGSGTVVSQTSGTATGKRNLTENQTVTFINNLEKSVLTGIFNNITPFLILVLISLLALIIGGRFIFTKRTKNVKKRFNK